MRASAWAVSILRSLAQLRNATAERLTPLIFERMDESLVLILDMLQMPLEDGVVTSKTSPHPSQSQWPPAAIDALRTRLVRDGCVCASLLPSCSSSPCGIISPSLRRVSLLYTYVHVTLRCPIHDDASRSVETTSLAPAQRSHRNAHPGGRRSQRR